RQVEPKPVAVAVERLALDEVHHQPWATICVLAAVKQPGDAGMVEAGQDPAFLREPFQERGRAHVRADQLERAGLGESVAIAFGQEHRAHAAAPELPAQGPGADPVAGPGPGRGTGAVRLAAGRRPQAGIVQGAGFQRRRGRVAQRQQFLELRAQLRLAGGGRVEEGRAFGALALQCFVEQAIERDARIAARTHSSALSSQARARIQSRCTVRSELSSAIAVSSSPMPAKKRHSTTLARRGLNAARSSSARSAAVASSSRSSTAAMSAVSVTAAWPPPRLAACRIRAWSTRMRRMARAQIAKKWPRSFQSTPCSSASWR